MNMLEHFITSKTTYRIPDSRPGQQRPSRAFGRDITNVQKRTSNISFVEKPVKKCEVIRIRSSSMRHTEQPQQHPARAKPEISSAPILPPTASRDVLKQYELDVAKSLLQLDCKYVMIHQTEITERMRAILIDWLVDVHQSFGLLDQTLHLCLRYFDEYSSKVQISKLELQLVGITCLLMASKFQEIYPPRIKHFVDITANTYTSHQLQQMEAKILQTLRFQMIKTTSVQILQLCMKREIVEKFSYLCKYLLEMSNIEGITQKYRPSVITFAAINLANSVLKTEHTDLEKLRQIFAVSNDQMLLCFKDLFHVLSTPNKYNLKAIKKKYSTEKCFYVSKTKLDAI